MCITDRLVWDWGWGQGGGGVEEDNRQTETAKWTDVKKLRSFLEIPVMTEMVQ